MFRSVFSLSLAMCLFAPMASLGQSHTPASNNQHRKPVTKAPLQEQSLMGSFDTSTVHLSVPVIGHDLKKVYSALEAAGANKAKTEFETTAAYDLRRTNLSSASLFGTLTTNSTFAFIASEKGFESAGKGFETKYDADSGVLKIVVDASITNFLLEPERPELITVALSSKITDRDSYVGSNAYGAKVEVSRSYSDDFGLAIEPETWPFEYSKSKYPYRPEAVFDLKVVPELAQRLKKDLRLLFVGKLKQPWIHHTVSGHEPTIDSPYETTHSENYLRFEPQEVWAVDGATGNALQIFKATTNRNRLTLEISGSGYVYISKDGGEEQALILTNDTKITKADELFKIRVEDESRMTNLRLKLNGRDINPQWEVKRDQIGQTSFFRSASATIKADQ